MLRDLHPQILRGRARTGVQLAPGAVRSLRGLHPQPTSRGLGIGQDPLRRWRVLGWHHGAAGTSTPARRHPGRPGRHHRRLQGRPADPLAYDASERTLIVNPAEVETVRRLFALYIELGCVRRVKEEADRLGFRTKRSTTASGTERGGKSFSRGHIYILL